MLFYLYILILRFYKNLLHQQNEILFLEILFFPYQLLTSTLFHLHKTTVESWNNGWKFSFDHDGMGEIFFPVRLDG